MWSPKSSGQVKSPSKSSPVPNSPLPTNPPAKKPSIWLKDDDYLRCHQAFRRASNEFAAIQNWAATSGILTFPQAVRPRVLSVGCGAGEMDLAWMQHLIQKHVAFDYVGIDPNGRSLGAFLAQAPSCKEGQSHLLSAVQGRFEDFPPAQPFHLVVFMHSLYHFADRPAALRHALSHLVPGGRLLIVMSDDDGLPRYKSAVYAQVEMPAQSQATPGSDLRLALRALAAQANIHTITSQIDTTHCLDSGDPEGEALLDFFFLCRTSFLGEEQRKVMLRELPQHCCKLGDRWVMEQPILLAEVTA